jgi:alanine racemase
VEVNLSAIEHNARVASNISGNGLLAVVKANAYGHGAISVASALLNQTTMFGVANLEEARELRETGIQLPILLLGTCLPEEMEVAVRAGFHVGISSESEAALLNAIAKKTRGKATAHIFLDTGMGRMGFPVHLWNRNTISTLSGLTHIIWEGLASHLPAADGDAEATEFTSRQIGIFRECVELARAAGLQPRYVHLSNSAGLLRFSETHDLCNLARPGLMLYGVSPLANGGENLRPALQWKTRVLLVRELPSGHGISYGRSFVTSRPTMVATLACGYADGFPRQVSGQGACVLIHGKRCPIMGRVTMDQLMVDVTDLPAPAQSGEVAVLLGTQGSECITASELAEKAATIPWHIFTGIGERVQRVCIRE